jgi:SPP1 gp7 family putative phage head morphogenesis protein
VPPAFDVVPEPLPFEQAIETFRDRLPLPPEEYARLADDARARAFTVGGVASDDLIADVYAGIERALAEGTTFEEFRQNLGERLEKAWGGDEPWRLSTVFQTNVQSAYQAGHYKQMTDPDVLAARPIWRYDAVNDGRTRPSHRALDGMTAGADDPIWDTHYPPNGFNCRCSVITLSPEQVEERGIRVLSREETARLARNFRPDKGFEVNPGKAAFGRILSQAEIERLMAESPKGYVDAWTNLSPRTAIDYGRPRKLPAVRSEIEALPFHKDPATGKIRASLAELQAAFVEALGGEDVILVDPIGTRIAVSAAYMFNHLTLDGRERFLRFVPDVLRDPQEIWLRPLKSLSSGRVVMRRNYMKSYELGKDRLVQLVVDQQRGAWVGYTAFTKTNRPDLANRSGILLFPR